MRSAHPIQPASKGGKAPKPRSPRSAFRLAGISLTLACLTLVACQSREATSAPPASAPNANGEATINPVVIKPAETPGNIGPWDDYYDDDTNNWLSRLLVSGGSSTGRELTNEAVYPFDADVRRQAIAKLIDHPYGDTQNAVRMYRLLLGASGESAIAMFPADEDPTVRAISVKSLGIHGDPSDAEILVPFLKDESDMVRLEVATALQKLHDPNTVGPLIAALIGDMTNRDAIASTADEDPDVRAAAAVALGQYREPRAFGALVTGLFDRDYAVVAACHESLIGLSGQTDLSTSPDDWLAYAEANRSGLFEGAQDYLFEPFPERPGFWRRMIFWSSPKPPPPQPPKGIEQTG